ncbi:hypothetical protein BMS3Bbin01_00860 [bacterium BMS3Bbin01]|nr:hypothetical protein BMS3Bbin01_00860 [bacterium BMS3Bbin01]
MIVEIGPFRQRRSVESGCDEEIVETADPSVFAGKPCEEPRVVRAAVSVRPRRSDCIRLESGSDEGVSGESDDRFEAAPPGQHVDSSVDGRETARRGILEHGEKGMRCHDEGWYREVSGLRTPLV